MLAGRVVGNDVDDHLDLELMGAGDQHVGVGESAEPSVDGCVVDDVVAGVVLR